MTLLSVARDVCANVGVTIPTSVFSGITGNRTMQEMLSVANEMAQRIAYDTRDWQKLRKIASHTGDGIKTAFDLPADFKRMLKTTSVWGSTSTQTPLTFINDTDLWLRRRLNREANSWGEWTLIGDQINVYPIVPAGGVITYAYLHKNCIQLGSSGVGTEFLADIDSFALDERLFKLGMIWQWKALKGSPYAEDMSNYADALSSVGGADQPAPILVDRLPASANVRSPYPWLVG